ncbi:histidine phosphatase family protein [Aquabacterium sp. A3]|uniref:SixA phosphatase family protein n=1 Tax=Aquabacterium sp. A3 TaxID=3132829 RepID=UPI0031198768
MDLILWRHAQAEALPLSDELTRQAQAGESVTIQIDWQADLARVLTAKGQRQAERMAVWLNARLPEGTRVLVSPAQRTQQTALALGRSYKTVASIHPQASVDDLLAAARWPDARTPALIVGHQPALGQLAARLLTGQDLAWSVKKGGVWWLRSRERDGQSQLLLHAVQNPDSL